MSKAAVETFTDVLARETGVLRRACEYRRAPGSYNSDILKNAVQERLA